MPDPDIVAALRRAEVFATLDDQALGALAAGTRRRTHPRGTVLFLQGDPGDGLYLLLSGRVKIAVESLDGDEMVLATLAAPDTFGELALIDGGPRSATAEVMDSAELLHIGRSAFRAAYERHPQVAESLLQILGRLVRRITGQAADLALLDLEGRVARLLVRLQESAGGAEDLELGLTQSEVASMVGGSRQSVNQILHTMARRGYLEVQGRRLKILRAAELRERAGL